MLYNPSQPEVWLKFAESDLAFAKVKRTQAMMIEKQLFHAQQAAEKALKAVLVLYGVQPPKNHNIKILAEMLPEDLEIPESVLEAAILTQYSTILRYPGLFESATESQRQKAVKITAGVLDWSAGLINRSSK